MVTHAIFQLSDAQLTAAVHRLARDERSATLALVVHLAVFDERRLYLGAAYPSLFAYCRAVLKLSEHEAYHRILAARTGRAFPLVFEMLDSARINLTTVRLLATHLTPENHVWMRDGGCCTFQAKGRPCGERGFLEFHHVQPFAAGGEATRDNIALRCRAHNAHEAELFYGRHRYNGARKRGGAARGVTDLGTRSGPSSSDRGSSRPGLARDARSDRDLTRGQ
jgi:hypothetical protein